MQSMIEQNSESLEQLHNRHTAAQDSSRLREMKMKFILGKLKHEFPWLLLLVAAGIAAGILVTLICSN
jgi:hypothetical protein